MFDEETARQTISTRNRLRKAADLPELNCETELAKLRIADANERFERFFQNSPARTSIEAEVLALARRERNDPDWVPRKLLNGAMWYSLTVRERMRQLYKAEAMSDMFEPDCVDRQD